MIDSQARFLLAWTAAVNLTAIRDPVDVARLHVLDSLAAVPLLRDLGIRTVLDLGTGGGYPGLPIAAALDAEQALLVDSVGKKVHFVETVVEAIGMGHRIRAVAARAETLARDRTHREAWQAVTARAVASLADLVEVGLPLVAPGGVLVAWKRAPLDVELADAGPALAALRAGPVSIRPAGVPGLDSHRLVVIPRAGSIDPRYPRDPADRRRRRL